MKIVVMGATGNVGDELAELLASMGHEVRALSRQERPAEDLPAGVRSFAVDLAQAATLRGALTGADGAFMLSGYDDAGLVDELERAGVARVALLSSGGVGSQASPENAVVAYHLASEQALTNSDLAWTFLRPNTFMTNALRWADKVRAGERIVAPFAQVPIATNDPRDVAAVAAASLTEDGHSGQAYRISGAQALRPEEQVAILGSVLDRELHFEPQSDDDARAEMEASMPTAYVDAFFEFFAEGKLDETTVRPTVEQVTGAQPRSFRDWAREHAAAFR